MKVNNGLKKTVFILFCTLQMFFLIFVIINALSILSDKKDVKLKCSLNDPFYMLKGRYINLSFDTDFEEIDINKMESLKTIDNIDEGDIKFYKNRSIYCIIEEGDDGYFFIKDATFTIPKNAFYITFRIKKIIYNKIRLKIHFREYYLQESFAYGTEKMLRENDTNVMNPTLVLAVGKNGRTVQRRFEVYGIPIEDYIKNRLKKDQ